MMAVQQQGRRILQLLMNGSRRRSSSGGGNFRRRRYPHLTIDRIEFSRIPLLQQQQQRHFYYYRFYPRIALLLAGGCSGGAVVFLVADGTASDDNDCRCDGNRSPSQHRVGRARFSSTVTAPSTTLCEALQKDASKRASVVPKSSLVISTQKSLDETAATVAASSADDEDAIEDDVDGRHVQLQRGDTVVAAEELLTSGVTSTTTNAGEAVESDDKEDDDEYPNFARHGSAALLPRYLTPEVYERLRYRRTSGGVRLEDCIRAGIALPHGSRPPRGMAGVYVGDADSYRTFAPLLAPLIQDNLHYRGINQQRRTKTGEKRITDRDRGRVGEGSGGGGGDDGKSSLLGRGSNTGNGNISSRSNDRKERPAMSKVTLRRHESDLNYNRLLSQRVDPEGEYVLYTRMSLARSLEGFRFAPCMSRTERRRIEALLKDCVQTEFKTGWYLSVMDMSNQEHDDLQQRRVLFPDPDDFAISAGLGRDWPDARGIYCDSWSKDLPAISIWCNAEDHFCVISSAKGGDVQAVFTKLSQAVWALETALKHRGHRFVEDERLGFLNTSPANIGTALRASVYVKLVRLSKQPGFFDLIQRLRLEARSPYRESDKRFISGIYDIANAEALGKSEVSLINIMIIGVGVLIELEKRLERGEHVDLNAIAV